MICMTSRGGDYSENSPFHAYDFLEPYLRVIFGYVGITDIQFINAQPMEITHELRESAVKDAIEKARELAASIDLSLVKETMPAEDREGLKPAIL
jgi:FMN-dependent NADH-azoreductase